MDVKVAICQKPPVLLDLKSTIDKAIQTLAEASEAGAQLVVFLEAYLPGYPTWIWRLRPGSDMALGSRIHSELRKNSVDIAAGGIGDLPICRQAQCFGCTGALSGTR